MGLEQLLPGGLYKAVVRECDNNESRSNSKVTKCADDVSKKLISGAFEMVRDLNYLILPGIIFSDKLESNNKALGVALFSAYYVAITYGAPLFIRGLNCISNKL
ncbi:MAG: hypothetical protein AABX39_00820 [Nanoarchaeota archaeon]